MKAPDRPESEKKRAMEALKAVLQRVSGVRLMSIDADVPAVDRKIDIVAEVDVHGHSHTLACMVMAENEPQGMHEALAACLDRALELSANAMPVLIAHRLSTELQMLCRESKAGVLDLDGNARLEMGEVFIACQMVAQHRAHRVQEPAGHGAERKPPQKQRAEHPAGRANRPGAVA